MTNGPLKVKEPFTRNILQKVEAAPWPYVPVDLLPIFVALGIKAEGSVMFWNKIYDGAMGWTSELAKFGGHAFLSDPHRMITFGGKPLSQPRSRPLHHPRGHRAPDGGGQHSGSKRDQERHAHPPRAPELRRAHLRAGCPHRVGGGRLRCSTGSAGGCCRCRPCYYWVCC